MIRQPVTAQLHGLTIHVNRCWKYGPVSRILLEMRIACASLFLMWDTLLLFHCPWAVCNP